MSTRDKQYIFSEISPHALSSYLLNLAPSHSLPLIILHPFISVLSFVLLTLTRGGEKQLKFEFLPNRLEPPLPF